VIGPASGTSHHLHIHTRNCLGGFHQNEANHMRYSSSRMYPCTIISLLENTFLGLATQDFALVSDKPLMCKKRAVSNLTICSCNIRSLLEISGDIRISLRDSPPSSSIVYRKLDLLVGNLRYMK